MKTTLGSRSVPLENLRWGRAASRFRSYLALPCLLALGLSGACASSSSPTDPSGQRPGWLQSLISTIESEPVTNPPSSILRYRYRGATVYFRPSRCCDIQSDVYDQGGSLICHADGGITGGGDGRCSDFFSARADEQLVWQDSRR